MGWVAGSVRVYGCEEEGDRNGCVNDKRGKVVGCMQDAKPHGRGYMLGKDGSGGNVMENKDGLMIEQSDGMRDGRKVTRRGRDDTMINIHSLEKAPLLLLLIHSYLSKGGFENPSKALSVKKVPRSAMSSICKRPKPKAVHVLL